MSTGVPVTGTTGVNVGGGIQVLGSREPPHPPRRRDDRLRGFGRGEGKGRDPGTWCWGRDPGTGSRVRGTRSHRGGASVEVEPRGETGSRDEGEVELSLGNVVGGPAARDPSRFPRRAPDRRRRRVGGTSPFSALSAVPRSQASTHPRSGSHPERVGTFPLPSRQPTEPLRRVLCTPCSQGDDGADEGVDGDGGDDRGGVTSATSSSSSLAGSGGRRR